MTRDTDPAALRRQLDALTDLLRQESLRLELAEVEAERAEMRAGRYVQERERSRN